MINREEITEIGKFHKTHALRGELNTEITVDSEFITTDIPLIVEMDGIFVPFYADSVRPKGHFSSLLKLHRVDTEDDAKVFVNKTIFALRKDVQAFEAENDWDEDSEGGYAEDFVGYSVIDSGREVGVIQTVDIRTQNALFVLKGTDGEPIYIPVAEEMIQEIDSQNKTITMTLPEGLIDLNS